MPQHQLDILDREARIFACYQAVTDLLSPDEETRRQANLYDLVDFITDEYAEARQEMRRALNLSS
jgi:hypothetical protein